MIRWVVPSALLGLIAAVALFLLRTNPELDDTSSHSTTEKIETDGPSAPTAVTTPSGIGEVGHNSQTATQRETTTSPSFQLAISGPTEPAANIEVAVLPWNPDTERIAHTLGGISLSLADSLARRTYADARGNVEIHQSDLPCFVAAASPALAPNGILIEHSPGSQEALVLECTAACSVTGKATVLGVGGQAGLRIIAKAGASADWYYGSAGSPSRIAAMMFSQEGITSHDGSFTIHGLPTGNVYLHIDDPRYSSEGFYFDCSNQWEAIALVARPAATIQGHVLTADGVPVQGAWINATELLGPFDEEQMDVSISDETGSFTLRTRAGRKTYVRVMHHVEASASEPVDALTTGEIREIEIRLPKRTSIQGLVESDIGDPLSSIVVAYDPETGQLLDVTSTDSKGRFTLTRLELENEYTLHAHPTSGACLARFGPVLAGTTNVRIQALRVGSLAGTLTGAAISSYDGVRIRALLLGQDGTRTEEQSTYASADGSYVIPRVYPGVYRVDAIGDGFAVATAEDIHIAAGKTVEVDLELEEGTQVVGTVIDETTGQPIQGAEVTIGDHDADNRIVGTHGLPVATDARGLFALGNISSAGSTTVRVSAPGYATRAAFVTPDQPSEISLSRAASLRIILEREPGFLARGIRAEVIPNGQAARTMENPSRGELSLEGLAPGLVEVYARLFDDNLDVSYRSLQLVGGDHHELRLQLGGPCGLSVSVDPSLSNSDNPSWCVTTWSTEDEVPRWQRYFEGFDGSQDGLPPGRAVVRLTSVGNGRPLDLLREVDLVPGQTPTVHFTNDGLKLFGTITDARGTPIPGGTATVWGPRIGDTWDDWRVANTSLEGEFQLLGLQPGRYELVAHGPGFAERSIPIDLSLLTVGQEKREVIQLDREVSIDVHCRADGAPSPTALVYAGSWEDHAWVWLGNRSTDQHGMTSHRSLPGGLIRILVKQEGRFTEIRDLEVAPGDHKKVTFDLRPARDLTITVGDRQGRLAPGVTINATAAGFSGNLSSWFEERRVKTSTETLQTDPSGVIELYRVPAEALEIHAGNQTVLVPPGQTEVSLVL